MNAKQYQRAIDANTLQEISAAYNAAMRKAYDMRFKSETRDAARQFLPLLTKQLHALAKQQLNAQPVRFEVQTRTVCDGWLNCWHEDDQLKTYPTREDAQQDLDEFLIDTRDAGLTYYAADYRIVAKTTAPEAPQAPNAARP